MHTAGIFVIGRSLLLFMHTCPVTEFAAFKYGKFLLPPRFLTALSVPTVPTREQLLSLSHISIKMLSYSYHDADTIFPVSFILTASSFRAPCLFLLDRNGPNVSSRSRRTIYIQTNPRNAPLYSALFPLDLLGFRTKTIFCNENSNFPYYFQLCHRLYLLLQISSVICPYGFWNTIFQDKYSVIHFCLNPVYMKKERLHTLRVPYTVFLYPPFDSFISTAPATAFPLFSDTSFPSSLSYESGPGYAHPHWQGGRKSHPPARRPACGSHLFPSSSLPPVCLICTVQTSLPP